jgi:fatty acid desaturase
LAPTTPAARLSRFWHRYEGPTWLIAFAVYGGWFALLRFHSVLPWWIVLACGAWLVAWHGSLQHETIHALEHVPRPLRALLSYAPLGVFFPFGSYERDHRRHHQAKDHMAEPGWDPETFYHDAALWRHYPRLVRALFRANQTLLGRLTLGVALQALQSLWNGTARIRRGDAAAARDWAVHVALVGLLFWGIGTFAGMAWWKYIVLIAYPGASMTMLRSFYEHRWTDVPAHRTATIENRFPFGLLFLNNNYHAVHHAAPALPWYRIPAAWRANREALLARSGGYHFPGYETVARRWFVRPVFDPVRPPE